MDVSDKATQAEEVHREAAVAAASRTTDPIIRAKRERIATAREILAQHGPDDPDLADFSAACENCEDEIDLSVSEDIFCCKECAEDWHRRERMNKINGAR